MAPLGQEQRRYDTVTVRVSRIEKTRLYAAAAEADVTVSEYVRNCVSRMDETDRPK